MYFFSLVWDAQSQNQEKLGWGPPYFYLQGGLKIGKFPKNNKFSKLWQKADYIY